MNFKAVSNLMRGAAKALDTVEQASKGAPATAAKEAVSELKAAKTTGWAPKSPQGAKLETELAAATQNIGQTLENQTRNRGLPAYVKSMDGLDRALAKLQGNPDAHWVDVGGGHGNAQRGFLDFGERAFTTPPFRNGKVIEPLPNPQPMKMTLLDLEPPASLAGITTKAGNIETMPLGKLEGSADIITDNIAAWCYSTRPDTVLRKELAMLKPEGKLFLGLGQSGDTFAPAVDSTVVSGGRLKTYGEWLESNPTLAVTKRTRTIQELDDVHPTYKHAYEIAKKPGVEPQVPELEPISLEAGGPPRVTTMEKGAALFANPKEARAVEAETRAALEKQLSSQGAGGFFDLFRGGATSNLLASAASDNRGQWAHLGPVPPEAAAAMKAGEFDASARYSMTGLLGAFRGAPQSAVTLATHAAELPKGQVGLISDSGHLLASTTPSTVLAQYFDALTPNGQLLLNLGRGSQSEVLTAQGKRLTLAEWLGTLPGVSAKRLVRRGERASEDEVLMQLTLTDQSTAKRAIPQLEALGARDVGAQGNRLLVREQGAPVVAPPTAKSTWDKVMDWAWGR